VHWFREFIPNCGGSSFKQLFLTFYKRLLCNLINDEDDGDDKFGGVGGPRSRAASGTIYVRYLTNNKVDLSSRLSSGSRVKLRLPAKNRWKAINQTFHVSAQLGRFVAALVAASSTDRTDRWTEWGEWSGCTAAECGQPGLRTRRRICVSTTGAGCSPGVDRGHAPCLGGGMACAAAVKALSKISCLVGTETRADVISKKYAHHTFRLKLRQLRCPRP